jgi:ERCC4-type nuclease
MSTTAKITITLDYRERDLHAKMLELLAQNQTIVNKIQLSSPVNLDVGDIIIAMADYGSYLIERKRIDDMSSSIKDGRYAEQKARCQSYIVQQQATAGSGPCNLIYLLEGTMDICRSSADYTLVQGSWISLALRDKVPVIRVLTMEEGCKWLIRLCERVLAKPTEFFPVAKPVTFNPAGQIKTIILGQSSQISSCDQVDSTSTDNTIKQVGAQAEYLTTVKTKKKDNITPATCAILMLAVIPGMTTGTAQVILEQLGAGTLPGLISSLSISAGTPEEQSSMIKMKKKLLAELVIKPGRRLGPALADKIWDYLFNISS